MSFENSSRSLFNQLTHLASNTHADAVTYASAHRPFRFVKMASLAVGVTGFATPSGLGCSGGALAARPGDVAHRLADSGSGCVCGFGSGSDCASGSGSGCDSDSGFDSGFGYDDAAGVVACRRPTRQARLGPDVPDVCRAVHGRGGRAGRILAARARACPGATEAAPEARRWPPWPVEHSYVLVARL